MRLRNTNPCGEVELPLIRRSLAFGEVFDVPDEVGAALLEQVGNYALVEDPATTNTTDQGEEGAE